MRGDSGVPSGNAALPARPGCGKVHPVSTVQEIEAAIEKLPRDQFLALVDRLRARHADEWDRQIAEDAKAGRLDFLVEEAKQDIAGGKTRPLDEILDDPTVS